jgi:hypothetical protein
MNYSLILPAIGLVGAMLVSISQQNYGNAVVSFLALLALFGIGKSVNQSNAKIENLQLRLTAHAHTLHALEHKAEQPKDTPRTAVGRLKRAIWDAKPEKEERHGK